jgi:hypothetical protein
MTAWSIGEYTLSRELGFAQAETHVRIQTRKPRILGFPSDD